MPTWCQPCWAANCNRLCCNLRFDVRSQESRIVISPPMFRAISYDPFQISTKSAVNEAASRVDVHSVRHSKWCGTRARPWPSRYSRSHWPRVEGDSPGRRVASRPQRGHSTVVHAATVTWCESAQCGWQHRRPSADLAGHNKLLIKCIDDLRSWATE
jgi:hypothetical protein